MWLIFNVSCIFRYSDIYKCSKGGHCQITLKTRKNCQFCRFQACEKAGMKRSWVLADGDPTKNKNKTSIMFVMTKKCFSIECNKRWKKEGLALILDTIQMFLNLQLYFRVWHIWILSMTFLTTSITETLFVFPKFAYILL